ncbi:MAG: hypothetical protein AABX66_02755 [Nanoarchaeota archaeon]
MNKKISKEDAKKKISELFNKKEFKSEEVMKIKKLAMNYKIRLGVLRKQFCKKCLSQLRGKIRVSKGNKRIECEKCGFVNRIKIFQ